MPGFTQSTLSRYTGKSLGTGVFELALAAPDDPDHLVFGWERLWPGDPSTIL